MVHETLVGYALIAATVGGLSMAIAAPADRMPGPPENRVDESPDAVLSDRGESPVDGMAEALNPFRWHRSRAAIRFDPNPPPAIQTVIPPVPERPTVDFRLTGIIWGSNPVAIVEGLPGASGAVVLAANERRGAFTVDRITPDSVLIAGYDTVWVLRVGVSWDE